MLGLLGRHTGRNAKERAARIARRFPRLQEQLLKAAYFPRFQDWKAAQSPRIFPGYGLEVRDAIHRHVIAEVVGAEAQVDYLEFGVHKGASIRLWVAGNTHPASRFTGFDSFQGLPEDWIEGRGAGVFDTGGQIPQIDDPRVAFQPGWFHQTLPPFLSGWERQGRIVLHLDADLYRSTLFALLHLGPHLRPGDVLIFDEFCDTIHEFRAFDDFIAIFGFGHRALCANPNYKRVVIELD